jgi:hypothetical protein
VGCHKTFLKVADFCRLGFCTNSFHFSSPKKRFLNIQPQEKTINDLFPVNHQKCIPFNTTCQWLRFGYGLGYLRINDDLSQEVNPSTAPTQDGVLLRVHPLRRFLLRLQRRDFARSSG